MSERPLWRLDLYVILDPDLAAGRDLAALAEAAIVGGATMLQLRHKGATTRQLLAEVAAIGAVSSARGVPLIVNDRVDVVLASSADGVHLGPDDLPPGEARRLLGPDRIIGVSAGSAEEALEAEAAGADYLGVGAIYATASKADAGPPAGPGLVAIIRQASGLPLVGIGGIGAANAGAVIAAGADGVAVISAVATAPDPAAAAIAIRAAVDQARQS